MSSDPTDDTAPIQDPAKLAPPPLDPYAIALRVVFWLVCWGILAFAVSIVWPVISKLLSLLSPFLVGLIIAYVFHPIVHFFERRWRIGRVAGILVVVGMILIIITGFVAILGPILWAQGVEAYYGIKQFVINISERGILNLLPEGVATRVKEYLSEKRFGPFQPMMDEIMGDWLEVASPENKQALETVARETQVTTETLTQAVREAVSPAAGPPVGAASVGGAADIVRPAATGALAAIREGFGALMAAAGWVGGFVISSVLTAIVTFYYLAEMSKIPSMMRRALPNQYAPKIWDLVQKSDRAVGGFIRGQMTAALGVGILTTVLLLAIGPRPYAVLIGFAAGLLNIVPYLGPAMGAAPTVLYGLLAPGVGDWGVGDPNSVQWGDRAIYIGLAIAGFSLIQSIDGFVFQPLIVGRSASLHPIAVMIALVIGGQFGIGGMIIAVPVACIVKVLFVELYWRKTTDFMKEPVEGIEVERVHIETAGPEGAHVVKPVTPAAQAAKARTDQSKKRKNKGKG